MKQKLIVYGCGSMAKTYASYLKQNYHIAGYTVEQGIKDSEQFNGLPLHPFERLNELCPPSEYLLIIAVGYSQMNRVRQRVAEQAQQQGYQLVSYFDDSVKQHENTEIGSNSVVFEHSSIHCDSRIGNNVFISSGVHIGHDCIIEDNVWINSGVCLGGGVTIKSNSFIGMNATISHGVTVAENSFIGAATLVNKATEQGQVVISPGGETLTMNSDTFLRFSKVMNNG